MGKHLSAGPADESTQTLSFEIVLNSNLALFATQPAISSTGTLSYAAAANASGSATITIRLKDSGGTADEGTDVSLEQVFTITVDPVNDSPFFTPGPDQTVAEDSGAQTVSPWATPISAGAPDEEPGQTNAQTLSFEIVSNTNAALFAVAPTISPTGGS